MKTLENLYEDCRSYIGLRPVEMTSSDALALYAFVEQYTTMARVPKEIIDAAKKTVDKLQKFHVQV